MAAPLTKAKREDMFRAWCEKATVKYVADTCHVSRAIVRKYREVDSWSTRVERVHDKLEKAAENQIAKTQARHLQEAKLLQKAGVDHFTDADGKFKAGTVTKSGDAIRAIEAGVGLERTIMGEPSKQEITLKRAFEDMTEPELIKRLEELKGK